MDIHAHSLRPFLGAREFDVSRDFYSRLGFREVVISPELSVFNRDNLWFYLQNYYVQDWVDNTMMFLEVDDLDAHLDRFRSLSLPEEFPGVRLSGVQENDWGREFFLHDPAGILWHIGEFHSA